MDTTDAVQQHAPALDPELCRRARLSRDPRFDGSFYLGVRSTGIYCRPICPARPAAERNVLYFRHAAEAAAAGFRPCLRCRPESAPGSPAWEGVSTTVRRALQLIHAGELNGISLAELGERLGIGERYLRKLFRRELGVSPQALAHNQRLLFARKLITETDLPLTEVAFAAGFGSVRRFNSALREAYGEAPGALRRVGNHRRGDGAIRLQLQYRPPYDWQGVLGFFGRHAIDGLESVDGEYYRRRVSLQGEGLNFCIGPSRQGNALELTVELDDHRQLMPLLARVRRMFDLDANPAVIAEGLGADPVLRHLLRHCPGVRSPLHWSPWEAAVRAIVGQQVSVAGARTVCGRLVAASGGRFPAAADLIALEDREFAMPARRRDTLRGLGVAWRGREHRLELEPFAALPGVGPWTTRLVAMRGFGDPDAFPDGDLGLLRAWQSLAADATPPPASAWRPWRSYAANLLWSSL
jgi:AraC family transcriptional regulator of adaptative response / DNA-3-methyladenine glycosylase II